MGKAVLCLLSAILLAGPAYAAPIVYNYTSGQVTVTATAGATEILSATVLPLSGVFVEFDSATIDLSDLLLTIPMSGVINMANPYGGYDQFQIESADISDALTYATLLGSDDGGGNYSFVAGPLDINGVYSAFDSNAINPPMLNVPVPFTDTSLISGTINIFTGTLTLSGITLAEIPGGAFGEPDDLVVKADIVFVGTPEPGTAALVGLGLLALGSRSRRRSTS